MNGHISIVCCFVLFSFVAMCNAVCPINCYRCEQTSNNCEECNTGYYLNANICYQCSSNCRTCNGSNDNQCTGCKVGYFLRTNAFVKCSDDCSDCANENTCITCKKDFFPLASGSGTNDCYHCGSGRLPACDTCQEGKFGTNCTRDCSLCRDSVCLKTRCAYRCIDGYYEHISGDDTFCAQCNQGCLRCDSHSDCKLCEHGKYLVPNAGTCIGCGSNCDSCSDYNNCGTCVQGTWGADCGRYCSLGCFGNACNKDTGICNNGCKFGYYENAEKQCTPCSDNIVECQGFNCPNGTYLFVNNCIQCPSDCQNKSCNQNNGNCEVGCIEGWRGHKCDIRCMGSCEECERLTDICTRCQHASYGNSCNETCHQCVNFNCDITGKCLDGCITGYSGDNCESEQDDQDIVDEKSMTEKQPVGVVIGAVIGGLCVVILLICVVVFVCVRRRNSKSANDTDTTVSPGHTEANTNQDMGQRSMSVILPDYVNTCAARSHGYENTTYRSGDSCYDSLNGRHANEHIYKQIEMTSS